MSQSFDASRSLTALEQDSTIIASIEISQSKWLVAAVGALPTLSVRARAIIVLNDHRFWGSFWPFIVRQHAPIVHPWPCCPPQRPTARAVSSCAGHVQ
jgi:hypothetical protein